MSRQTVGYTMPIYAAGDSDNIIRCCWGIKESVHMLLDLLHFQFRGSLSEVKGFLQNNYDVSERLSGKRNTICIVAPANSRKKFWVDGVCDFCLNPRKMENPNRSNNFAFSTTHNRRVIKLHKCNFD